VHKNIHTNALLLLDSVCHVLVDLLLVVSITQLTLLVCQTCTPDGCITEHRGVKYQVLRIFTKDKRSRLQAKLDKPLLQTVHTQSAQIVGKAHAPLLNGHGAVCLLLKQQHSLGTTTGLAADGGKVHAVAEL